MPKNNSLLLPAVLAICFLGLNVLSQDLLGREVNNGANDEMELQWQAWRQRHAQKHRHRSLSEAEMRKAFFRLKAQVDKHNRRPDATFRMKLNKFADIDNKNYRQRQLGLKPPPDLEIPEVQQRQDGGSRQTTFMPGEMATLASMVVVKPTAAELDWRKLGMVTPVEDQGSCACCWAFAAAAAIESRLKIKTGLSIVLSKQHLIDCDKQNDGCNGGYMHYAYQYVKEAGGLNTERAYPYREAESKTCRFNASAGTFGRLSTPAYRRLQANNETAFIEALKTGPIAVGFDSSRVSFQTYAEGIYSDPKCTENVNHAMLLVGYATDPKTKAPYWILKNSFGEDWGEQGYIRVIRGGNTCGILSYGTYPIV